MEKQYFIVENNEQLGPFTIEELKQRGINKTTLVWNNSLDNWVVAQSLDEFKFVFQITPPPIPIENNPKIIYETEEPLQFEDVIKKKEIEKLDAQNQKSKSRTANEIKRIIKFIKVGLIIGIVTFIISFGFLDGYKYLYYYLEVFGSVENVENEIEMKFVGPIDSYNEFLTLNKAKTGESNSFDKWSKLFSLYYMPSEDEFYYNIRNFPVSDLFHNGYVFNLTWEKRQTIKKYVDVVNYYYYYQNKNGIALLNNDNLGYHILKVTDLDTLLRKGEIVQKTTVDFQIKIHYGKFIMDNLNTAWKNSLLWGVLFFCFIFPLSYIFLLLIELFKKSKYWIEEHATK